MLNHPQNAQVIIHQRWKELQTSAERHERARAALPLAGSVSSWRQRYVTRLTLLRQSLEVSRPILGRLPAAEHDATA